MTSSGTEARDEPPPSYQPPPVEARRKNWIVVVGAVLILVGFWLFAIVSFRYAMPPTGDLYDFFRSQYLLEGIGQVQVGFGFFLAFLGIAWKPGI